MLHKGPFHKRKYSTHTHSVHDVGLSMGDTTENRTNPYRVVGVWRANEETNTWDNSSVCEAVNRDTVQRVARSGGQ